LTTASDACNLHTPLTSPLFKECETKDAPQNVHDFAKQYLKYSYYQDLMGICLKMKPFETNESESNLSFQKMLEAFKELEVLSPNIHRGFFFFSFFF
jgi:hypothetical protein